MVRLTMLVVLAVGAVARGEVRWRGDFETGDLSQWTRGQVVSSDRIQVVTSPLRQGRYAARALVKQGDDPINASGNRAELLYLTREPVGSEFYYKWSTLFSSNYPSATTWQLFTQWHHEGNSGSPPIEFVVNGETMKLRVGGSGGTYVWQTPLVRNVWHDFVFHVRWSPDPKVGFVELWHNNELVLPKRFGATQFAGMLNYLKIGLYRDESISGDGVVFHDGMIQATALADVFPLSTPDAGTPDAGTPNPDRPDAGVPGDPPDDGPGTTPGGNDGLPGGPGASPHLGCASASGPPAAAWLLSALGLLLAARGRRPPSAVRVASVASSRRGPPRRADARYSSSR